MVYNIFSDVCIYLISYFFSYVYSFVSSYVFIYNFKKILVVLSPYVFPHVFLFVCICFLVLFLWFPPHFFLKFYLFFLFTKYWGLIKIITVLFFLSHVFVFCYNYWYLIIYNNMFWCFIYFSSFCRIGSHMIWRCEIQQRKTIISE